MQEIFYVKCLHSKNAEPFKNGMHVTWHGVHDLMTHCWLNHRAKAIEQEKSVAQEAKTNHAAKIMQLRNLYRVCANWSRIYMYRYFSHWKRMSLNIQLTARLQKFREVTLLKVQKTATRRLLITIYKRNLGKIITHNRSWCRIVHRADGLFKVSPATVII